MTLSLVERLKPRADRLGPYLAEMEETPFAWGTADCTTFAAEWVEIALGITHGIDWPVYSTKEEAAAIVEAAGGLVELWRSKAPGLGLFEIDPRHDDPVLGDIGIVDTMRNGAIGGVFGHGGCLYVRTPQGTTILTRHILAAWRLPE
ncbi:hypothetical protein ATO13_21941 [Stappia sp. 22II-S9-Z10]|nr:hypothetical protein ATO13_21941 [Stappia sp. 22II-S9-Z10]